jgi:hypothetical protein
MRPKQGGWGVYFACGVLLLVLSSVVAASMAQTTDEPWHVYYGSRVLGMKPDRVMFGDDSKMP